jgi:hypothetical protein
LQKQQHFILQQQHIAEKPRQYSIILYVKG